MYRFYIVIIFIFSLYFIPIYGSWVTDLFNPSISMWTPYGSSNDDLKQSTYFDNFDGFIVAFGDFNSDRHVDVFVLSQEQNSNNDTIQQNLQIFQYSSTDQYLLSSLLTTSDFIVNVIPSDFNKDGNLDVLVQSKKDRKSDSIIYFGDRQALSNGNSLNVTADSEIHLLLMDFNMDLVPDLFGVKAESSERGFWINDGTGDFTYKPFPSTIELNPIVPPHSNAFVDINGDCLPDLVIFSVNQTTNQKFMEIWLLDGTSVTLDKMIGLPEGAGQVSFADFDRDGTTDFIFPICIPTTLCTDVNTIEIVYNVQEKMCTSITGSGDNCTDSSDVCGVMLDYTIPNTDVTSSTSDIILIDSNQFNNKTFFWQVPITGDAPNTIQIGDYNADGYPDILLVLESSLNETQVELWDNTKCSDGFCGSLGTSANRRTFQRSTNSPVIENANNTWAATFFDILDDGTLDMLVLTYPPITSLGDSFSIISYQNWKNYDTFFLKVTGLSGLCMHWCDDNALPKFPDPYPIGTNQPGAVIKYIWSDNNQDKRVTIGTQLSQSGYFSLQTPYVYFGLGDTSNYIQQIYFGVPTLLNGKGKHFQYFPDITPNSQIVCIPSPPDKPYFWSIEVFMRPSGMTFWTIIACIVTCIALAITALFFAYREKKKDAKEAEEKGHVLTL